MTKISCVTVIYNVCGTGVSNYVRVLVRRSDGGIRRYERYRGASLSLASLERLAKVARQENRCGIAHTIVFLNGWSLERD